MIRPSAPRRRATVRSVPRRPGRPPAAVSAELRSRAIAAVQAQPTITGAALARELGIDPTAAGPRLLAELRAEGLAPPARAGADGRALVGPGPGGSGKVVRLSAERLARLATLPGDGPLEQIDAALDRAGVPRKA